MATVHIPLLILLLHTCFGSTSVEALAGRLPDEESKSPSILFAPKLEFSSCKWQHAIS